ncbi:MAG: FGGY family carbohydrate kinase [Dermatophilaceae bacterium]
MTTVLAIDQGTSGTKAIVVGAGGAVLATAEIALRPRYLDGGAVEQDPEVLFDSVLAAGRRAVADAAVTVDAVALANQGESVLAWDEATGRPLTPVIVWQDRRAESWCRHHADRRDRVHELTGLELDPYFSAPKMRWLRDTLTTDGVVTTTDTWLVHRLCGAFVTDSATASRSLLLDLDDVAWSAELRQLFGLHDERLPRIVPSDEIVGETTLFGSRMPVAGLVVDQQAALLAEACLEPGTAKCTFGTGAFLLAQTGPSPVRSGSGLTASVAWTLGGATSYCLDGQVYTAASAVRWAVDTGLLDSVDRLDEAAAPSSEGVVVIPAFAGLAAPWWQPTGTATISGLRLSTRPAHVVRALVEGIACQVAELAALVGSDTGVPLTRLRVDGGLTRSTALMQAQADLAQLPVEVYPSAHATPLGAAACARLAVEDDADLAAVVGGWTPERTYEPIWSADRAHSHLDRWHRLADTVLAQERS